MANLNRVMLIGRLTRDPEKRTFQNGGAVTRFGFAVNNRRKNNSTGQWEDEPVFLDVEAFNRGENGTLADRIADTLRKGQQVFIEGHLKLDQWEKDGVKRQALKVVVDNFQYLEPRQEGQGNGQGRPQGQQQRPQGQQQRPQGQGRPQGQQQRPQAPQSHPWPEDDSDLPDNYGSNDGDIPF